MSRCRRGRAQAHDRSPRPDGSSSDQTQAREVAGPEPRSGGCAPYLRPSDMADAGRASLAMSGWVDRLMTMAGSCVGFETPTARPGFNPIGCPRQTWGADRTAAQRYRASRPVRSRSSSRPGWSMSLSESSHGTVTVCPSVLLRSEPAAVRFKAAIAPRCGRTRHPARSSSARHRRAFAPLARKSAPLGLDASGP